MAAWLHGIGEHALWFIFALSAWPQSAVCLYPYTKLKPHPWWASETDTCAILPRLKPIHSQVEYLVLFEHHYWVRIISGPIFFFQLAWFISHGCYLFVGHSGYHLVRLSSSRLCLHWMTTPYSYANASISPATALTLISTRVTRSTRKWEMPSSPSITLSLVSLHPNFAVASDPFVLISLFTYKSQWRFFQSGKFMPLKGWSRGLVDNALGLKLEVPDLIAGLGDSFLSDSDPNFQ